MIEETSLFHLKDHGKKQLNPWRSLAENTRFDFLKPIGGFTVSRVLRSQMIFAACFILCAAGSLFTSNSADSANIFSESNITFKFVKRRIASDNNDYNILTLMAESLTTQSVNSH